MKKILTALMCIAAITMFTACGGGNSSKKQSGETKTETKATGGTEIKTVSQSNWQAVIKSNFGVDLVLPEGWSFKEVNTPNRSTNIKLFLNM